MAYKVALLLLLSTLLIKQTTTAESSSVDDTLSRSQCKVGTLYKSTLPSGGTGVEHLKVLGDKLSADECINQCCSLGPERCQYLWVLKSTCIAVACEKTKMSSCLPQKAVSNRMQSIYVSMEHPRQLSDGFEEALEWVNQFVHGGKAGGKDGGDSPPIAATRTDEVEVTLPKNEVYIYGNYSKDDEGISAYSWKLLTEHFVQPILENADKAILHVRNLIPGTYQFSLTVTDTAGQSGRTTVLVRVNKGSTEGVTMGAVTTEVPTQTHPTTTASPSSPSETTTLLENTTSSGGEGNDTAIIEDHNQDMERYYTKRRNVLKIVIPVLLSLAVVLVFTAAIVTACACCCERNKHRMKRYYKYKKLPETIEKT